MRLLKSLFTPFSVILLIVWMGVLFNLEEITPLTEKLFMALTMAFGSFIAGATSEGGGAVAFPAMTLLFKIDPTTARDFALLIQSCGMTAAAFYIYKSKIKILPNVIMLAALGGILGNFVGLKFVLPYFPPIIVKIFFCSLWVSFLLVFLFVRKKGGLGMTKFALKSPHEILLVVLVGALGGIISSLVGTGIDIITFSLLTLYFGVCEKVATPSTVILMAINSLTALLMRQVYFGGINPEAFEFGLVCLPVVLIGAPLGAMVLSKRGKKFLKVLLSISILAQYALALWILPLTGQHYLFSFATMFLGITVWTIFYLKGHQTEYETVNLNSIFYIFFPNRKGKDHYVQPSVPHERTFL